MSNQIDKARTLLEEMESGTCPVLPGMTCYDGFILACARCRAWDDIITAYRTMQYMNVPLSPASSHGVLLAAAKVGHRSEVKKYIEQFVSSNVQLYGDGAILALRILLNGVITGRNDNQNGLSLDELRERLRILGQTNVRVQNECLQLIRSLRIAESEEARHVCYNQTNNNSNNLIGENVAAPVVPLSEWHNRRHDAWHTMLNDLLTLVNAIDASSTTMTTVPIERTQC
jgi:hypothetical protein